MARGGTATLTKIKRLDNIKGGDRFSAADLSLTRAASVKPEPDRTVDLRADHPALFNATTIFPSTVVPPGKSERLLVSGKNNSKLGNDVRKGAWAGMPLYQLTLEERATCPRSCVLWSGCYGNSLYQSRRHAADGELTLYLAAELLLLNRAHPQGFVVRLHTLGDFYSVAYVEFWRDQLERLPGLHVFGYTANKPEAKDPGEAAIGNALADLTAEQFKRFAIRFSGRDGLLGTIVVNEDPKRDNVIVCPAQTDKTTACATCGLCWAPAAANKTIAFLRHGMKGAKRTEIVRKAQVVEQPPALPKASERAASIAISPGKARYASQKPFTPTPAVRPEPKPVMAPKSKAALPVAATASPQVAPYSPPSGFKNFVIAPSRAKRREQPKEISAADQRLIEEALAAGMVTECPPGEAWGAAQSQAIGRVPIQVLGQGGSARRFG